LEQFLALRGLTDVNIAQLSTNPLVQNGVSQMTDYITVQRMESSTQIEFYDEMRMYLETLIDNGATQALGSNTLSPVVQPTLPYLPRRSSMKKSCNGSLSLTKSVKLGHVESRTIEHRPISLKLDLRSLKLSIPEIESTTQSSPLQESNASSPSATPIHPNNRFTGSLITAFNSLSKVLSPKSGTKNTSRFEQVMGPTPALSYGHPILPPRSTTTQDPSPLQKKKLYMDLSKDGAAPIDSSKYMDLSKDGAAPIIDSSKSETDTESIKRSAESHSLSAAGTAFNELLPNLDTTRTEETSESSSHVNITEISERERQPHPQKSLSSESMMMISEVSEMDEEAHGEMKRVLSNPKILDDSFDWEGSSSLNAPINASPINASSLNAPINASPINASPINAPPINAPPMILPDTKKWEEDRVSSAMMM
jgi:hypothetical protein